MVKKDIEIIWRFIEYAWYDDTWYVIRWKLPRTICTRGKSQKWMRIIHGCAFARIREKNWKMYYH